MSTPQLVEYNRNDASGTPHIVEITQKQTSHKTLNLQKVLIYPFILVRNVHSLRWVTQVRSVLYNLFLPSGYPESVSDDYVDFHRWDCLQALCSYLRQVMVTGSTLSGLGVGNNLAQPTSAALMLLWREGVGVVGGLFLHGEKALSLTKTVKLIAPLLPTSGFFILHLTANVFHSICGIAGGATSAAFHAHFAKRNNTADICSKHGNIGRAVSLVGLLLSTFFFTFLTSLENSSTTSFFIFSILTILHLYFNIMALRSLRFADLNKERAYIIAEHYCRYGEALNIALVARKERFWRPLLNNRIRVGCSILEAPHEVQHVLFHHDHKNWTTTKGFRIYKLAKKQIFIVEQVGKKQWKIYIHKDAKAQEIWIAFLMVVGLSKGYKPFQESQLYSFTSQLEQGGWRINEELDLGDEGWRFEYSKDKSL
eukprot:jgi/Galph1/1188/GphlegSOOS_G5991.1